MPSRPLLSSASPRRSPGGVARAGGRPPADGGEEQFDLWPPRVQVEALDVRSVVGAQTRVTALYRVRYEREPGVHQVFHDHHGWYCADHGPACKAVRDVTARHVPPPAP